MNAVRDADQWRERDVRTSRKGRDRSAAWIAARREAGPEPSFSAWDSTGDTVSMTLTREQTASLDAAFDALDDGGEALPLFSAWMPP